MTGETKVELFFAKSNGVLITFTVILFFMFVGKKGN